MKIDAYLAPLPPHQKKELVSLPVYPTPTAITLTIIKDPNPLQAYFTWVEKSFGTQSFQSHQVEILTLIQAHPDKTIRFDVI